MDAITRTTDYFLHIDAHPRALVARIGEWVRAILFAIAFCETGLVVTPFLPGDSLLFATGTLAEAGVLDRRPLRKRRRVVRPEPIGRGDQGPSPAGVSGTESPSSGRRCEPRRPMVLSRAVMNDEHRDVASAARQTPSVSR